MLRLSLIVLLLGVAGADDDPDSASASASVTVEIVSAGGVSWQDGGMESIAIMAGGYQVIETSDGLTVVFE